MTTTQPGEAASEGPENMQIVAPPRVTNTPRLGATAASEWPGRAVSGRGAGIMRFTRRIGCCGVLLRLPILVGVRPASGALPTCLRGASYTHRHAEPTLPAPLPVPHRPLSEARVRARSPVVWELGAEDAPRGYLPAEDRTRGKGLRFGELPDRRPRRLFADHGKSVHIVTAIHCYVAILRPISSLGPADPGAGICRSPYRDCISGAALQCCHARAS